MTEFEGFKLNDKVISCKGMPHEAKGKIVAFINIERETNSALFYPGDVFALVELENTIVSKDEKHFVHAMPVHPTRLTKASD